MKHLKYLNKFFWKYRWRFILGILFVVIANVFGVLPPVVVRHAFNLIRENIGWYQAMAGTGLETPFHAFFFRSILFFAAIVVGLALTRGIFMFFMRQTLIVMSRLIEFDLRNEMYAHYQKLDQGFYRANNTGDLMSRVAEDVSRVRMYLGPVVMYAINTLVLFVIVISVMLRVNAELTVYVLLPLPVLSLSIYYLTQVIHKKSEKIQQQLSFLTTIAQEVYSGIRIVKSYVREKAYGRFFARESEAYRREALGLKRVEAMFFPLMLLLIGLSTILTIYVGGRQVMAGKITTGNIAEFVMYVTMLTWPVTSLGWIASLVQRAAASQKRINEFLQSQPAIQNTGKVRQKIRGDIEFRDVWFTYPETGVQALKGVSFAMKAGQRIAIVGRTGSGKTTIADLLMRVYDPQKGEVLVDGIPVREYDLGALRESIGYVPQDVFLFSDTVAANIAFGQNNATREAIMEVARLASVHDEIMSLPKGYDTLVGERGITLSGGQKQRISIARAFLNPSDILVLDDCLSAVDAATEEAILNHLNTILANKTAIVITHRIFSLLTFDKILVLDKGRIVEEGTHYELLQMNGLYKSLYEKQKIGENSI